MVVQRSLKLRLSTGLERDRVPAEEGNKRPSFCFVVQFGDI